MNEWDNEPSEMSFESHGLACRMARNSSGAWCGYVCLPESHPWHGKSYSDQVPTTAERLHREFDIDKVGAINLLCAGRTPQTVDHADMVLLIDVHGGLTYSGKRFGDEGWWLGFDCSHANDVVPAYDRTWAGNAVYRNADYVKRECESLAEQLSKIGGDA